MTIQTCFKIARVQEEIASVMAEVEGVSMGDVAVATIAHYSRQVHKANGIQAIRDIIKVMMEVAEEAETYNQTKAAATVTSILERMKK